MQKLLYIGSNIKFAEKLKEVSDTIFELKILDTKEFDLLDFEENVKKGIGFDKYNLENNTDIIDGFIIQVETHFRENFNLSECLGLELLKHILLTESMGELRQKKFLCLSFFRHNYHIRNNADNAILFAPEVRLLDIILQPETITKIIFSEIEFYRREVEKEEIFEKNLNNYVIWTDKDKEKYVHDGRNYAGILRLYREYYIDSPNSFNDKVTSLNKEDESFKIDINQLGLKKIIFKHKINIRKNKFDNSITNNVRSLNFSGLIVDDKSYWIEFFKTILKSKIVNDCNFNYVFKEVEPYLKIVINTDKKAEITFKPIEYKYDVLFIDLYKKENVDGKDKNTPEGMVLLKNIRQFDKFTPVIMFTASEDPKKIQEVFQNGCTDYFMKDKDSLTRLFEIINENLSVEKIEILHQYRNLYYFLSAKNENNSFKFKFPQLSFVEDDTLTYQSHEKILLLSELPIEDRLLAIEKVESIFNSSKNNNRPKNEADLNNIFFKNCIQIIESKQSEKNQDCYLNSYLCFVNKHFNNNSEKKIFNIDNTKEIIDNTKALFNAFKPVKGVVFEKCINQIVVKVINTDIVSKIDENTLTKLGFDIQKLEVGTELLVYKKHKDLKNDILIKLKD